MCRILRTRCSLPSIFAVLALAAVALLLPVSAPAQATPDTLVEAWHDALIAMDYDTYDVLLHQDYRFIGHNFFTPPDVVMSRFDDLLATANMFSGYPCQTETGNLLSPVLSVSIPNLTRLTTWDAVPPTDPHFPDTVRALYECTLILHFEDLLIMTIGDVIFFVTDIEPGRADPAQTYRLAGLQDLASPGRNEDATLTDLKWLYAHATVGDEAVTWGEIKTLYAR